MSHASRGGSKEKGTDRVGKCGMFKEKAGRLERCEQERAEVVR